MTSANPPAPPAPPAMPKAGGSYVREPDGTLTRTGGTNTDKAAPKPLKGKGA